MNEQSDGQKVERVKFLLSEMETEVVMRSWDLGVTANIGSAEIQDYFTKGEIKTLKCVQRERGSDDDMLLAVASVGQEPHVLLHSGSNKGRFISATYCKVLVQDFMLNA